MTGRRTARLFGALALLGLLAACGNDPQRVQYGAIAKSLSARIGGAGKAAKPQVDPALLLTPTVLQAIPGPVMVVQVEKDGRAGPMLPIVTNGTVTTWRSPDKIAVNLEAGLVISTRGFSHDLLSAEVSESLALIASGQAGPASRIHRHLGREDQVETTAWTCSVSAGKPGLLTVTGTEHPVRPMREACTGSAGAIENRYWVGLRDGIIWRSRQWVSPEIGYLVLQNVAK